MIPKYENINLTTHAQYLEILSTIEKDTAKVQIVQIDGYHEDDPVINAAKELMTLEKEEIASSWFGTETPGRKAVQYTFRKTGKYFEYLRTFESFFIGKIKGKKGYCVELTDFGIDDIAFLDKNSELLFYTTTHEGYAYLNEKYIGK